MKNTKRQIILIILLIAIVLGVVWMGSFVLQHARGIVPLIKSPGEDIAEIITEESSPLTLPEEFSISIFAEGLEKPRVLTRGPAGNILVSIPSEGKVVALPDRDGDGVADEIVTVIEELNRPHGLATKCFAGEFGVEYTCKLFIAETDQVAVYDYDRETLKAFNKEKIVDLPSGRNHFTRTILFAPTPAGEKLLISVGSSCNVCNEEDARRASVLVSEADGSNLEIYARGLRNAVFMAIHPVTGQVWVTEMGRDLLGDDLPPDEINIVQKGNNYGWPICYGKNVHDTAFDENVYIRAPCSLPFEEPSYIDIEAHSAPLGLAFVPEEGWPEEYWYNLIVAYHGSWNRSEPTGYKLVRFILDENGVYEGEEDFITGWLTEEGRVLGRPAGLLIEPEGVLYISDDRAGVVYRVVYNGE